MVTNATVGARLFYSTNGLDPVVTSQNGTPVSGTNWTFTATVGQVLSFHLGNSNLTLKIKAGRQNFKDSEVITKEFKPDDFVPNRISFGFEAGEASSVFLASPGQRFYAPVTLSLLTGTTMYSLQFNVTVDSVGASPIVSSVNQGIHFESMLKALIPGRIPPRFLTIRPAMVVGGPLRSPDPFDFDLGSLVIANTNINLLAVGWVARFGSQVPVGPEVGDVWDLALQDLIRFSIAHDTLFVKENNRVVVGGFSFVVPSAAALGQQYEIQIGRPSATSDGIGAPGSDVFIESPTNGPIRGLQTVNIGLTNYTVGDVAPFRWFNAGDYGDGSLLSDDVQQVYQSAIYALNLPPGSISNPRSDFFDAMDSAGGAIQSLVTSNTIQTNFVLFTTNSVLVTNTVITNLTLITTNIVDSPSFVETLFTNQFVTTNILLTNMSVTPGFPIYGTNVVLITNDYVIFHRAVLPPTSTPSVATNIFPVAQELIFTNYTVFPSGIYSGPITVYSTNLYVAGTPVPANGVVIVQRNPNLTLILSDGGDATIDSILYGDGLLNVDDVYVTYRRSLDPTRLWVQRYWSNGMLQAVAHTTNVFRGSAFTAAQTHSSTPTTAAVVLDPNDPPRVKFAATDVAGQPGAIVDVPIRAEVHGGLPLRVLMLNLNVIPVDGSPQLEHPVFFVPNPALGQPTQTFSKGAGNYSAAWLDASVPGIEGNTLIGTLRVQVPDGAPPSSAYRIEFEHASGSPNGVALLPATIEHGVLSLSNLQISTWNDGISDAWRIRHFGSIANELSAASADADGDGQSNGSEFSAGTNPNDVASVLRMASSRGGQGDITLRWPTVANRLYTIERTPALGSGSWDQVGATVLGTGQETSFTDSTANGAAYFYRVQVVQ